MAKRRKGNNKGQSQLDRMRVKLPAYLFNADVIRFPKVTIPEIQKHMGAKSRTTVYRLLKDIHLDPKSIANPDVKPLSADEIGDYLVNRLTLAEGFGLYNWALAERFDKQLTKAELEGTKVTRAYGAHGVKRAKSKTAERTEENQQEQAGLAKQAVNNSPFTGHKTTPVTDSAADKVKSAIVGGDLSHEQANKVALAILNRDHSGLDETEQSYVDMLTVDSNINQYQWAVDWLYKHSLSSNTAQTAFYRLAQGGGDENGAPSQAVALLAVYRSNRDVIDISKVGDSVDY